MASAGGKCVERHLHAFVSDGMEAHLESGEHTRFGHLVQLGLIVLWQAGVLGIIGVRLKECGCVRAERPVHKGLEHAGMQHVVGLGMRFALGFELIERRVKGKPFRNAGC